MLSEQQLKDELASLLENEKELNYSKILLLSNELAKFDKDNIRFSVDAGVIDRLGKELVARHETAVSELVKNAYDADALKVRIQFSNVDNTGGTLVIDDDGDGMTRDQLINGFMRISSTSKIHEPVSPIYNRSRAGKKGIGRFSAQRLGEKLTIISQTKDSQTAIKIVVDWAKYRIDDDIFFISNKIEEIPKEKEHGTTLIIEKLRDYWSETMIKRIYRYAIDIIQPFPLSINERERDGENSDPGFEILCTKDNMTVRN